LTIRQQQTDFFTILEQKSEITASFFSVVPAVPASFRPLKHIPFAAQWYTYGTMSGASIARQAKSAL
jgi:hypothetical protein